MNRTILSVMHCVVGWVIPSDLDRDAIIGDLEEEHAERLAMDGRRRADRWLLSQLARSVGPLLRTRVTANAIQRSTLAIVLAWLSWAGVFATLIGASVWLFRAVPTPSGLRILVYLGVAFLAAATSGRVARRAQPANSAETRVVLARLLAASIGAIFYASPEHEALAVWLVWTTVVTGGVFVGARSQTGRSQERV